jgi:tRNA (mo5U34)-methyltransferase
MRTQPPDNFSVADFCGSFYSFQQWELFPGHIVPGAKDVISNMRRLHIPERLDGLRVLDIAPWNGFFGFECLRRGAAQVISLGPDDPGVTGYDKTRELLQISNCEYVRTSVYDLSPEVHGHFDVVMFLGLIYHLRHPLLAMDRIFDVASNRLFVDSPVIDDQVFDVTVGEVERKKILAAGKVMHQLPMVYFTKRDETRDPYNWFLPNKRALGDLIESSGFRIDTFEDDGGSWASVSATKGERAFTPGLEGWNEAASKQPAAVGPSL